MNVHTPNFILETFAELQQITALCEIQSDYFDNAVPELNDEPHDEKVYREAVLLRGARNHRELCYTMLSLLKGLTDELEGIA
jgi:hypothetical protein